MYSIFIHKYVFRFANVAMKMNDPLQTLYQLMSGRQPAAVTVSNFVFLVKIDMN